MMPTLSLQNSTSETEDEISDEILTYIKSLTKTSIDTISENNASEDEHNILGKLFKIVCQISADIYTSCQMVDFILMNFNRQSKLNLQIVGRFEWP